MDPALVDELSSTMLGIAQEVFRENLTAMIVKGSAVKGDFIPHFSDFDVHLFADDSVMRGPLAPVQSIAIPFQERFSTIDVEHYRVSQIQVMIISAGNHPPEWIPAMPGSYRLVYGELPDSLPDVTAELVRAHAHDGLSRYGTWIDSLLGRIVDKPDPQFADSVRLAGTLLKSALYEASIVLGSPPLETWDRSLRDVLDHVEPQVMPGRPASQYFERAWHWVDIRTDGNDLRPMFADCLTALESLTKLPDQR
jgi:hypothetical protein